MGVDPGAEQRQLGGAGGPRRGDRWRRRRQGLSEALPRIAGGLGQAAVGVAVRSDVRQARGLRTAARGVGMAGACAGLVYQEYGRGKGRWQR